jgi:RHS repeat-associated protein
MANVEAVWTIVGTTAGGAAKWATRVSGVESPANDLSDIAPFGAAFVRCASTTGTTGVLPVAPDGIRWYHADALGSTDCITGRDGSLRAAFAYWPNGETRASIGTAANEWVFSGKELDGETGMHHFEARAMLSRFGSFASPDPLGLDSPDDWIGDTLNLNLYAYAARNPLALVDPTGLEVEQYSSKPNETFISSSQTSETYISAPKNQEYSMRAMTPKELKNYQEAQSRDEPFGTVNLGPDLKLLAGGKVQIKFGQNAHGDFCIGATAGVGRGESIEFFSYTESPMKDSGIHFSVSEKVSAAIGGESEVSYDVFNRKLSTSLNPLANKSLGLQLGESSTAAVDAVLCF